MTPTDARVLEKGRARPDYVLGAGDLERVDAFRREKFSSVLVIMFTDIEGFTALTERHGDERVMALLEDHTRMMAEIVERGRAGRYIKNVGDAMLAVFAEPSLAVERALEIQREIARRNAACRPEDRFQLRIGLHMGQVAHGDVLAHDVFGSQVNRASRIQAIARGGQILMSEVTFDNARHWLQGEAYASLVWRNHGEWRLKGMSRPVTIHGVFDRAIGAPHAPRADKNNRRVVHGFLSRRSLAVILLFGLAVLAFSLREIDRQLDVEQGVRLQKMLTFYSPTLDAVLDGTLLRQVAPVQEDHNRNAAFDYLRETDLFAQYSLESELFERSFGAHAPGIRIDDHTALTRLTTLYRRSIGTPDAPERLYDARPYHIHLPRAFADATDRPPTGVPVLQRFVAATRAATCAFVPQVVRPPETLRFQSLAANHCTMLTRALTALAVARDHAGDATGADEALYAAARFAYHMGAEQYRYRDVLTSIGLQQQVAPFGVVLFRQREDWVRMHQWRTYEASLALALHDLERKRRLLSGAGHVLNCVSVQAASHVVEHDPRPFWRLEAGKELAFARTLWWNRHDSRLAARRLEDRIRHESDVYVREWLRVLRREIRHLRQGLYLAETTAYE